MLWTIFIIVLILWLAGLLAVPAAGNLIHVLLLVAVIILIVNLLAPRSRWR